MRDHQEVLARLDKCGSYVVELEDRLKTEKDRRRALIYEAQVEQQHSASSVAAAARVTRQRCDQLITEHMVAMDARQVRPLEVPADA